MRTLVLLFFGLLAALMLAAALLYKFFGTAGLVAALALAAVAVFGLKWLSGRLIHRLFMQPFRLKGRVLHNAATEYHSLTPIAAPLRCRDDEGEPLTRQSFDSGEAWEEHQTELADEAARRARLRWFAIDMTIAPRPNGGPFHYWEPTDLALAAPDAAAESFDTDDDVGTIEFVKVWDAARGEFTEDFDMKLAGPRRVLLTAGVEPDRRNAALRYYMEIFGRFDVPPHAG